MPIARDASGNARYVSIDTTFYKERPEDFLGNGEEYEKRVRIARTRVLDAIRFASVPLTGRGTCHEVRGVGDSINALTDFIDASDGRRANRVRKQRRRESKHLMTPDEHRLKSPQDTKRRRSALISGSEICPNFFRREYGFQESKRERDQFVDLMRWWLLNAAIERMVQDHELVCVGAIWYVPVSVFDKYDPARKQRKRKSGRSSKRTKRDDRSFHGHPNRDRGKIAA